MTADEMAAWLNGGAAVWRAEVGDDLLGGYAVLDYPKPLELEVPAP